MTLQDVRFKCGTFRCAYYYPSKNVANQFALFQKYYLYIEITLNDVCDCMYH